MGFKTVLRLVGYGSLSFRLAPDLLSDFFVGFGTFELFHSHGCGFSPFSYQSLEATTTSTKKATDVVEILTQWCGNSLNFKNTIPHGVAQKPLLKPDQTVHTLTCNTHIE